MHGICPSNTSFLQNLSSKRSLHYLYWHSNLFCFIYTYLQLRKKIVEFESQPSVIKEEGEKAEEEEEKVDTLVGSLSSHYGGDTSLLYHQMELHTREEKISQIILLRVSYLYVLLISLTELLFQMSFFRDMLSMSKSRSWSFYSETFLVSFLLVKAV